MKRKIYILLIVLLMLFCVLQCTTKKNVQKQPPQQDISLPSNDELRSHILIDTGKDGGVWWAPQGRTGDPEKPHQGKNTVDFLKSKGFLVNEFMQNEVLTAEELMKYGIIICPHPYTFYSTSEIRNYAKAVAAGSVLLLFSRPGEYRLAEYFGFQFHQSNFFSTLATGKQHKLIKSISDKQIAWRALDILSPEAIPLANIINDENEEIPVIAFRKHKNGYVFCLGMPVFSAHPFLGEFLELSRPELESLGQLGEGTFNTLSDFPAPKGIAPKEFDTIPQPSETRWSLP